MYNDVTLHISTNNLGMYGYKHIKCLQKLQYSVFNNNVYKSDRSESNSIHFKFDSFVVQWLP